jgi:SPP1 family predicted phage head-tail adaptor
MDIGRLNKRITIEQQSTTYDAVGQLVESWSTFATVWANIKHNSGAETIKSDAITSTVRASFRIRYLQGVDAGMRVTYQSSLYRITAVLPHVGDKRYLDIVAELINGVSP